MLIEILTFQGCPNADSTQERVRHALEVEAAAAEISQIEVATPEEAQRLRFLGSPSVRIDGTDVEPTAAACNAFGLMCRTYRQGDSVEGTPALSLIRAAIRRVGKGR
jgi:hypothetical protein